MPLCCFATPKARCSETVSHWVHFCRSTWPPQCTTGCICIMIWCFHVFSNASDGGSSQDPQEPHSTFMQNTMQKNMQHDSPDPQSADSPVFGASRTTQTSKRPGCRGRGSLALLALPRCPRCKPWRTSPERAPRGLPPRRSGLTRPIGPDGGTGQASFWLGFLPMCQR